MDITEEVIAHLKNNIKTKIGVSSIDGVGVFAIRDIKQYEEVFPLWNYESGIYLIPNDRLDEIPKEVVELLDMYFINDECGYKVIRLFKGFNLIFHGFSYCNSAWPNETNVNITNDGIAMRDIKAGEEILEWYHKNINSDMYI
jgi:SET domain-containing protein